MKTLLSLLCILISLVATAQTSEQTAAQVVGMIKTNVGVEWREPTVDAFKAGDSNAVVTGIAVTMMSTLDVLQRAAAMGDNFIITHEPTFYNHPDATEPLANEHDPVYEAKQAFIRDHRLIIWRFHDHWHRRNPDGIHQGMMRALGWNQFQDKEMPFVFHLPLTTLKSLALDIKAKLGIHALRVFGDSNAAVSTVGISEGFGGFDLNRRILRATGVDVLVLGEAHEWETIEYGTDAAAEGNRKGLIILGHIPSEQAGMEECSEWLKTFVTGVPIHFVPAKEPFWIAE